MNTQGGAKPAHAPQSADARPGLRQVLHTVLEEGALATLASRVVNGILILLILANVAAAIMESVPDLAQRYATLFIAIELGSLIVFTVEYLLRLWIAGAHDMKAGVSPLRAPLSYALSFNGIVDLLAVLPFWLALFFSFDLRIILVFRIFRFLKLARYSLGVRSLLDALYVERWPLFGCLVIFLGTAVLAASLMYLAERETQPDKFGTIPLAMWWAVSTLGTTGYGDVVPITAIGKIINAATIMCALVMIALPVGLVATAFSQEIHRRDFMVTWGMVARVPLFAGLSASEIDSVMRLLSSQTFQPGDCIVRRGEEATSMFFIASGEVEIEMENQRERLGPGHFFGEVAVLRRARRSANITATKRSNLLVLDASDLHALMQRDERIAQRIADVTRDRIGRELVTPEGDLITEELDSGDADAQAAKTAPP
jgi:voltage-gated potassium channel